MLTVDDVALRLGDRQVLDGVGFEVPEGRVVGLLGPNGAGKTTTMRVLFGVIPPDRGVVRWDGHDAAELDRRRWGYLPQERGLYPKMRAGDHVAYFGRLRGLTAAAAKDRAAELLERVELADRAGDKVERLSGGMQQRLQLACALVHDPDVLVLDEPFAGLDPTAVDRLSEVVQEQASAGRTVLFSSHQLDLVEDLCESIVLIHQGRVVLDGDLAELRAASSRRILRIAIEGAGPSWADDLAGATLVDADASGTFLQLDATTDALALLDDVRTLGTVRDFGLEQPRLSQLFREAVGDHR